MTIHTYKKVGQGQRLCNCVNSQILEGYLWGREDREDRWEEGSEIVLINLKPMLWPNLILTSVLWKKLAQGQRLCDCGNSQILEGYPPAGGQIERGL